MRLLFFILFATSSLCVHAEEAYVNGLYFVLNNEANTAMVKNRIDSQYHDYASSGYTSYSGDIVIPETILHNGKTYNVTSIEGGYDDGVGLTLFGNTNSLTIPGSITEIGTCAFKRSYNLMDIYMTVSKNTSIGQDAFSGRSINTLTIEETGEIRGNLNCIINKLELKGKVKEKMNRQLFAKNVYVEDIESFIKSGISMFDTSDGLLCTGYDPIGNYNLYINNELVENIVLPEGLTTIGNGFVGCSNIVSLTSPSSIVNFSPSSLVGCDNLSDLYFFSESAPKLSGIYETISPSRDIRSHTTLHVPDYAIESYKEGNEHHTVYTYWKGFKSIEPIITTDFKLTYYVDGEIYKTVKYKYDDEIAPESYPVKKGMTFSGWSEIPEKMPGKDVDVTGTFSWSKDKIGGVIYEVSDTINNNAAVIGNDNANGEVKIASPVKFDYDYSITDIVDFSFKNNTGITSVVIPESVRKIGDEAFYGCKNLTKIEIGKSVNQIEPRAFASIDKLTDITVYAEDVPDADRTAFENSYTEDYVTLHVPAGSLEKYKAVAPWKNFKEIVPIEGTESEPVKYSLIYQVDGETYQKYELEEGTVITPLEAPTKDGYTFSGWSEIPETMPANDLVIKGTFTENIEDETEKDEIKIGNIGKTTYCSEYDLDFTNVEGIKAYTATGYDNKSKTIWLTRVMTVPAGTGILVKGDAGTYRVPRSTEDAYYTNMFKGNTGDPIKIEETEGDMTNYYLSGKDGSFVSVNGSANIGKNKAYLQLPTKFFAGTRSIGVTYDDDGTTGIWTIEQGTLNDERYIWFNLQGQRVDKPRKGLYIRNGKKVVVR